MLDAPVVPEVPEEELAVSEVFPPWVCASSAGVAPNATANAAAAAVVRHVLINMFMSFSFLQLMRLGLSLKAVSSKPSASAG